MNFERPTVLTATGFDTFDLTVDLVIDPDLSRCEWKDVDEYGHVRRLGIVTDTEHQARLDRLAGVSPQPASDLEHAADVEGRAVRGDPA